MQSLVVQLLISVQWPEVVYKIMRFSRFSKVFFFGWGGGGGGILKKKKFNGYMYTEKGSLTASFFFS